MVRIDTPLLVTGSGPAALIVAKLASGRGLASVVVGHQAVDGAPAVLTPEAVAVLEPHGLFDVLRPYLMTTDPPTIDPGTFEEVLKHHCVADMNVTVYDRMAAEVTPTSAADELGPATGRLGDGRSTWELTADAHIGATTLPTTVSEAVVAAGALVAHIVERAKAHDRSAR